jgi:serine/threonine-protein kinase
MYGIGVLILFLILAGIFSINSLIRTNRPEATPTPTVTQSFTPTLKPTETLPVLPVSTELTPTQTPVLPTETATIVPTATIGVGSTMTAEKDGITLLYVPAGEFIRGDDNSRDSDEKPALPVYLDAFWIDRTEVTNAMYRRCVDAQQCNPSSPRKSETRNSYYASRQFDKFPVINVTWQDANNYCAWAGRSLPTEAQWEKAASWDEANKQKLIYPWGDGSTINCSLANYKGGTADCKNDTTQVGSYESGASPYGVLDMAGNVWEWVYDNYDAGFYDKPGTDRNPKQTIGNSDYRVVRGGAWSSTGEQLHTANRFRVDEFSQLNDLGFRCVLPEE